MNWVQCRTACSGCRVAVFRSIPQNLACPSREANGTPTVIIGAARDIVEHCGVPRFVFSDFPLGNPCGHPWDKEMQTATLRLALSVLKTATRPRTTVRSPFA